MRRHYFSVCRFAIAFLLVLQLHRLTFVFFLWQHFKSNSFAKIIASFFYGFSLDISIMAYVSTLPLLIFVLQLAFNKQIITVIYLKIYVVFLLMLMLILNAIDINIYKAWGSKIDYKVIHLILHDTREAFASSASSLWVISLTLISINFFVGIYIFNVLVFNIKNINTSITFLQKTIFAIISFFICGIFIRGGLGLAPINYSAAYFSKTQILNHAALNTEWVLVKSILDNANDDINKYAYFSNSDSVNLHTQNLRNFINDKPETCTQIINNTKPNICLIILENFSSDLISELGGEKNICPNMTNFINDGFLFKNIYASGDRTYKGLPAILSAQPALGEKNIIEENAKQEKLPSLLKALQPQYPSSYFLYGGDADFSNIKSYILSQGFQRYDDEKTLHNYSASGKWGISDAATLEKLLQVLPTMDTPFFATYLSLSNHEPFDLPTSLKFGNKSNKNQMLSTAYFTDSCLGVFIKKTRQEKYFKNTLFVFIADHGNSIIGEYESNADYRKFRIPLVFFGNVLDAKFKGKSNSIVGNQTDLAHTLLNQLKIPSKHFFWSKNLLNKQTQSLTHFVFNNGFGIIGNNDSIVFDANANHCIGIEKKSASSTQLLQQGKAFYQLNYANYLHF